MFVEIMLAITVIVLAGVLLMFKKPAKKKAYKTTRDRREYMREYMKHYKRKK